MSGILFRIMAIQIETMKLRREQLCQQLKTFDWTGGSSRIIRIAENSPLWIVHNRLAEEHNPNTMTLQICSRRLLSPLNLNQVKGGGLLFQQMSYWDSELRVRWFGRGLCFLSFVELSLTRMRREEMSFILVNWTICDLEMRFDFLMKLEDCFFHKKITLVNTQFAESKNTTRYAPTDRSQKIRQQSTFLTHSII